MGSVISRSPFAVLLAWGLNFLNLAVYLLWLIQSGRETLFYDRDGILGLIPIVPIVFIFVYLFRR